MAILSRVSQERCGFALSALCLSLVKELRCQGSLASTVVCGNYFEGGRLTNHCDRAVTFDFPQATI